MGIDKDYSIEDIRKESIEKLYDIMASCGSPGYYQMSVEELQRRHLSDVATTVANLSTVAHKSDDTMGRLHRSVVAVDGSIQKLADSSDKMERLTKWITCLTIALLFLTVVQVGMAVKTEFFPGPSVDTQLPSDQQFQTPANPSEPKP